MRNAHRALAILLVTGFVTAGRIPASHAHPAAATVPSAYMTTDPAYTAYDSNHAVAPPAVRAYPLNVKFLGVYFSYTGATPNVTSFHIDFTKGSTVVRKGQHHTLGGAKGAEIVDLPSDGLLSQGTYQAKVVLDGVVAASTSFSLIKTPGVSSGFMITGKAWDNFDTKSKTAPPRTKSFPGGVSRVGVYFEYDHATKADSYYGAVYDRYGALMHRSHDHPLQYTPSGDVALILPADTGSYAHGAYRTDIYCDGALIFSTAWAVQ